MGDVRLEPGVREVAQQLCYSERTVKNVLHDVVTKLNARSRSQAVAFAVLANETLFHQCNNAPAVTGAAPVVMGKLSF